MLQILAISWSWIFGQRPTPLKSSSRCHTVQLQFGYFQKLYHFLDLFWKNQVKNYTFDTNLCRLLKNIRKFVPKIRPFFHRKTYFADIMTFFYPHTYSGIHEGVCLFIFEKFSSPFYYYFRPCTYHFLGKLSFPLRLFQTLRLLETAEYHSQIFFIIEKCPLLMK